MIRHHAALRDPYKPEDVVVCSAKPLAPTDIGMSHRTAIARPPGLFLTLGAALLLVLAPSTPLHAQARAGQQAERESRVSDPPVLRRNLGGILGGVEMSAADSVNQEVVRRLDFDSYKEILLGLTQFGDRERGDWTQRRSGLCRPACPAARH